MTEDTHDLAKTAMRSVAWSTLDTWTSRVLTLVTFAILARVVDAKAFGIIALATVFTDLLVIVTDGGLSKAVIRLPNLKDSTADTAFWVSLGVGAALTVVVSAVCLFVGLASDRQDDLMVVLSALSLILIVRGASGVPEALLQRTFQFRALAIRRIASTLIASVLGLVVAFLGAGVWALVIQTLAREFVAMCVLWALTSFRPRRLVDFNAAKTLLKFGKDVVGIDLLTFVTSNADNFLIGAFLGPVALGYYAIAYRLLSTVTDLMITVVNTVALPVFSRLQHDRRAMSDALIRATRLSSVIAAPVFIGLAAVAPVLIPLLFGSKWHQSIYIFQLMCLVGVMRCVVNFDRSVLLAAGRSGLELAVTAVGAGFSVVVFGLTVHWGVHAVAVGLVVRTYAVWPFRIWALRHVIDLPLATYFAQWIKPVVVASITGLALLGLGAAFDSLNRLVLLGLSAVTGAVLYLLMTRLTNWQAWRELQSILRHLKPASQ